MTTQKCKYHADLDAVSKCEECGALICLDCKNIHRVRHSSSNSRSSYSTRYELCPECYANRIKKSTNPIGLIVGAVFIIIFMIVAAGMFSEANSWGMGPPGGFMALFFIIPIIMCGVLGYNYFVKGPEQRANAETKRAAAISALSGSTKTQHRKTPASPEMSYHSAKSRFYCQQCGEKIDKGALFCSNCGDTTADENRLQGYK